MQSVSSLLKGLVYSEEACLKPTARKRFSKIVCLAVFLTVLAISFAGVIQAEAGRPRPTPSQVLVTSDALSDSAKKMRIVTEVTKDTDETDTSWDYYTIIARVYDLTRQGPDQVWVTITAPSFAEELDHWPEAGSYPKGEQCSELTLSIPFVSLAVPLCGGGASVDFTTTETGPIGLLHKFNWKHEYRDCGGIFKDHAEYGVLVRVPQGAGLFAYTFSRMTWPYVIILCMIGGAYELYWGYVTYGGGGGADNFYYSPPPPPYILKSGVADAPDSGTGLTMNTILVGGTIFGWTGGGDRTLDTADYYQTTISNGYKLTVTLFVNGANIDLCMDTWKGSVCSRNPGTTDESVSVVNDAGVPKTVTIRVLAVPPNYGQYELAASIGPASMTVTIYTYEKSRGDPNPGYGQLSPADVYRDGVKIGTSDINGYFVDRPVLGSYSYYAKSGTYSSNSQLASSDTTLYLTILTPY